MSNKSETQPDFEVRKPCSSEDDEEAPRVIPGTAATGGESASGQRPKDIIEGAKNRAAGKSDDSPKSR